MRIAADQKIVSRLHLFLKKGVWMQSICESSFWQRSISSGRQTLLPTWLRPAVLGKHRASICSPLAVPRPAGPPMFSHFAADCSSRF